MQSALQLVLQQAVNQSMPLNQALAFKFLRYHFHIEMRLAITSSNTSMARMLIRNILDFQLDRTQLFFQSLLYPHPPITQYISNARMLPQIIICFTKLDLTISNIIISIWDQTRNPLFLDGVKLCCNPKRTTKSGDTFTISSTGRPERPWTSKAASPLVRTESESASKITFLSPSKYARTQTCETQPYIPNHVGIVDYAREYCNH
ncbi:oligouridylate binding protein 1B [Striga asiatica]|uniref:Oligouridylate binding protein 1B n=1 Tax=Striga asiatica TaxID=4170 RepID=A0A5A7PIP5_STRAF|nr:oligouridylate binding protein 1B [Striga asiatica]